MPDDEVIEEETFIALVDTTTFPSNYLLQESGSFLIILQNGFGFVLLEL